MHWSSSSLPGSRRLALALVALVPGCFAEPEPVDDDGGDTAMCIQAPCTASGGPDSTGPVPTGTNDDTGSSGSVDTSTDTGTSTGPATTDGADSSTGPSAVCGDGEINQPSEMCDSTPGCLDDCTFENYACNPLNNAQCVDGLRCGLVDFDSETFGCMPPGAGAPGDPCSGVPTNDGDCDVDLTCLFNFNTPLCDQGNCCVEFCDLLDPGFVCSGGAVCRPFFVGPQFQGLEHLGFCGEP